MSEIEIEISDEDEEYETVVFSIENFLKEYEKYPCLWDKKHFQFRNKFERVKCEEKLCETFNFPDSVYLRKKIRSVRGTYNTEIRKIKQCIDNDTDVYPPKLSWFTLADKFLRVTTDLPYRVFPLVREVPMSFHDGFQKQKRLSFVVNKGKSKRQKLNSESYTTYCDEQQENSIQNGENTEQYEDYEELESIQGDLNTEQSKFDASADENEDSNFDQTEHLEVASSVPEMTNSNSASSSDLSIIAKCLKTLTKSSENEFAAFGQWLALQLQSMPLSLALQMKMDIQAHLTKSRVQHMKNGRKA